MTDIVPGGLRALHTAARQLGRNWLTRLRIPPPPRNALVPLHATTDVILRSSVLGGDFTPQTCAQESAFAHELAARGRPFALTTRPEDIFNKSVAWFLPNQLVSPRLWDYSRQVFEFAASLERQGNSLLCSSHEIAFWENKVHMHQCLEKIGAPTPGTKILTPDTWRDVVFDYEPVLIKQEHSASSAGIFHFDSADGARRFVEAYQFRPAESLLMQEVVVGATRDLRVTIVGDRCINSATYWRIKSPDALASSQWTTTATRFDSSVEHEGIPDPAIRFAIQYLQRLGVRTAGVDLMWRNDDLSVDPVILEFSPHYEPNPPKPAKYANRSYKEYKANWAATDSYFVRKYGVFREIAGELLDQGLF